MLLEISREVGHHEACGQLRVDKKGDALKAVLTAVRAALVAERCTRRLAVTQRALAAEAMQSAGSVGEVGCRRGGLEPRLMPDRLIRRRDSLCRRLSRLTNLLLTSEGGGEARASPLGAERARAPGEEGL